MIVRISGAVVFLVAGAAHATLPPSYTLERGEIVADSGDERARVKVDCPKPLAIVVRGSDVLVACGDEKLTYTIAEDVMHPVLVDRARLTCFEFDRDGRCRAPYATISLDDETTVASEQPAYVVRRVRRTALGWGIVAASLGFGLAIETTSVMFHATTFCESTPCTIHDVETVLDVAAVIAAVGGTIAGIAVAMTSRDVKIRTSTVVPSIGLSHRGGMIGLRVSF